MVIAYRAVYRMRIQLFVLIDYGDLMYMKVVIVAVVQVVVVDVLNDY